MRNRVEASAPLKLALFFAFLAAVGGVAALAGAATGSKPAVSAGAHDDAMGMEAMSPEAQARANGLASSTAGFTFAPTEPTLRLGANSFRFRILGADGNAVRRFDVDGGVRLHLIVVRRDFVGYQHLHPRLAADGTWSVPLRVAAPGAYRAYADFDVAGKKTVLGYDLFVPGNFEPTALPAVRSEATVDGYRVALSHERLRAGQETKLHFVVSRNGRPVPSFETYVGRRGHLVALRQGDLAYSHVHPEPTGRPGEIVFHTELATAGNYRIFLQFKRAGVVHTAPFTVEVGR
jgi:hypothetical protein